LALAEAFEELKKVELLDERDQIREREAENAAEQAELDDIALMRVRGAAPAYPFPVIPGPSAARSPESIITTGANPARSVAMDSGFAAFAAPRNDRNRSVSLSTSTRLRGDNRPGQGAWVSCRGQGRYVDAGGTGL